MLVPCIVLLVGVVLQLATVTAVLMSSERNALIAVYNNTNGASWRVYSDEPPLTGWTGGVGVWTVNNVSSDPCLWYGVMCANNIVSTLAIPSVRASGTLPDGLFSRFQGLQQLDLSSNRLSGALPRLPNTIQNLRLVNNQFRGDLPDAYGLLPIREITLDNNSLTGTLPSTFGTSWQFVITFTITVNQISGTLPETLSNWKLLQFFDVGRNVMFGTLPAAFGAAWGASLRNFSVRRNNFSGTLPPEYANWTNVELFQVDNNPFVGTLPAVYGPSFKQIVNVLISSTRISGSIPNEWGSWAATVQSIQLYLNSLTGTLPPSFGNFSKLQSLNFAMNNLSGEVPVVAWSKLRGVQSITFQDNPHLYGSIPESWNSVFVAGSFVGLPSMVSVCRSHICAAKLSALPLGYGCIPVSAIPLLATVDASNMVGVLSQITWLRSVACNASVAPPAQHTVTESHTRLIPVHAIDRAAAKLSESQRVTVATAAVIGTTIMVLQFLPSSVGGAGSMHALQATTVVQHLRQLCLSQDASGNSYDYSNDVGANADDAVCCDAGTSPTQLSVGSGVHEAPLAGAIIGNTILVAAFSGARLLLQYFIVRKCHLQLVEERDARRGTDASPEAVDGHHVLVLENCPALILSVLQTMAQLTHGGIVASLWVPFTALFTPTVAAGIAMMLLSESGGGGVALGVFGVLAWVVPWIASVKGVLYGRYARPTKAMFRRRAGVGEKSNSDTTFLARAEEMFLEPVEKLVLSRQTGALFLFEFGPVFSSYRASRIWYFNVEMFFSSLNAVLLGVGLGAANSCVVDSIGWVTVASALVECAVAMFLRPFQARIDMCVLFSNNFLSALSQLVALLDDSQGGQTASATIGLIASILQLCATILLGVDLVLRRGGVMHASVGIQDSVQLTASAVPQRLQHGGSTLDSRTHFFENQAEIKRKNVAAEEHLRSLIEMICAETTGQQSAASPDDAVSVPL